MCCLIYHQTHLHLIQIKIKTYDIVLYLYSHYHICVINKLNNLKKMGHCYFTYLTEQQRQPFLSSSHSSYSSPAWLTARDFSRALPAGGG